MHLKSVYLLSLLPSLSSAAAKGSRQDGGPTLSERTYLKAAVTEYQLRNPHKDGVACGCDLLKKFGEYAVYEEGDVEYVTEANGYWSATVWTKPRCIFSPDAAGDVARGVAILKECKALFAVKGGGHYPVSLTTTHHTNV